MTILTREQIDGIGTTRFTVWGDVDLIAAPVDDLLGTARAYHDLRDAVLALHRRADDGFTAVWCSGCGGDYPCSTVEAVARVDGGA